MLLYTAFVDYLQVRTRVLGVVIGRTFEIDRNDLKIGIKHGHCVLIYTALIDYTQVHGRVLGVIGCIVCYFTKYLLIICGSIAGHEIGHFITSCHHYRPD